MAPKQSSPSMWTIRFRHHKTTVLLHVDPLQNISSIKADLWTVLKQTESTDQRTNAPHIPDSSDEILLARPIDVNDVTKGWRGLAGSDASTGSATTGKTSAKGKGKAKEGAAVEGIDAENLKSLGIKDNALLAFRFSSWTPESALDEEINDEAEDEDMGDSGDGKEGKESWDVVMPSWEDQYGVTNTGDAGALQEFEG